MNIRTVVDKLIIRQQMAEMTDLQFAERLGVSRQMWNFVKNGQAEPGLEMWQKVVRVYPELGKDIVDAYEQRLYGGNNGKGGANHA